MTRILTIIALMFVTPAWADYEQPSFEVVLQKENLAIRDYASVMVFELQLSASRQDAAGDAFRSLFNYISGNNEDNLEIPMTSPVAQTQVSKASDNGDGKWAIRFFIPRKTVDDGAPLPREDNVTLVRLKAQRYASISFKGSQSDKKIRENTAKLETFISENNYTISGSPVFAFYDPPFIPWFLRDNEILLPIE